MLNLIAWIIVGGISGWIASVVTNTDKQMGCATSIVVGMVGSLVGGSLVSLINNGNIDLLNTSFNNLNLASIVVSVIGSIIFLAMLKFFSK